MALSSPVPSPIHPPSWVRPAGNLEFQETRDLAEHRRVTPGGLGCDFSNGRQGAPIYAMHGGVVQGPYVQNTPGQLGDGSLICRINNTVTGETSGYAHAQSFSVKTGQVVKAGQQIGVVGATGQGITGPHLHTDYQKPPGTYHEILGLIGGTSDVPMIPTAQFAHVINKKSSLKAATALKAEPNATSATLRTYAVNTGFYPVVSVGKAWYGCWLYDDSPAGYTFGYFPVASCTALEVAENPPDVPPAGGFTQKDLDAAYNEGRGAVQGAAASVPPR